MLRVLLSKFLAMFRRKSEDTDFDAEVHSHLEMLIDENERRGMAPEQARRAALHEFGNVTLVKETNRESRGIVFLETLFADLKYAARALRANPGFTTVAVLTLTLGIGVVTTVFTAYNSIALKPLPVGDPSRVVRLERWFENGSRGDIQYAFSYPEYKYIRDHNSAFDGVVTTSWLMPVVTDGGEKFQYQLASANYFADLEVPARLGRPFLPSEDAIPGGNPVIVLSHAFWQRRFHGDAAALGQVLKLNGTAFTIIGVAAQEFSGTSVFPQIPDFWAPVSMQRQLAPGTDLLNRAEDAQFQVLARVKPGLSISAAESETAGLIRQFASAFKPTDRTSAITLQRTAFLGNTEDPRFQASALAMMLIVGMVLLVGCVNIANMLLARGATRQKEIGVRLALGASRGRVIRQLLTESFLLAILGGAGGLLLSIWTSKMLGIGIQQFILDRLGAEIAVGFDLSPDWRVLAYAMGLSLIAGVMFGLSPALQFSRPDLASTMKQEGGFGIRTRSRWRSLLIATQVAVSMMLLISAGLLIRGLGAAQTADTGFETRNVYAVRAEFGNQVVVKENRLIDLLRTLPEVRSVAVGTVPMVGTWTPPIIVSNTRSRTCASYAADGYFETLGIPLLRGRTFAKLETEKAAPVAVVSESAARAYWPNQDPIGKHFQLDKKFSGDLTDFEVVGVVKDVRFASLSRVDSTHVYVAIAPGAFNTAMLVRTEGDSRRVVSAIRSAAGSIDPTLMASISAMNLETGPVELLRSLARIGAVFAAILAGLALILAGVGIYGVMSYLVSQRVKEIGIRVSLGARAGNLLLGVVLRGLRPVIVGLLLGVALAAALSAVLHSALDLPGSPDLLFGVPFYDPITFVGLTLFLATVAAIASAVPARRALKVDPMIALRHE